MSRRPCKPRSCRFAHSTLNSNSATRKQASSVSRLMFLIRPTVNKPKIRRRAKLPSFLRGFRDISRERRDEATTGSPPASLARIADRRLTIEDGESLSTIFHPPASPRSVIPPRSRRNRRLANNLLEQTVAAVALLGLPAALDEQAMRQHGRGQ